MFAGQHSQLHTPAGIEGLKIYQIECAWLSFQFSLPGYDWAPSSKKEVPWIGISCISQVQLPWGRLPGNGHVLPEIGTAIFKSVVVSIIHTSKEV